MMLSDYSGIIRENRLKKGFPDPFQNLLSGLLASASQPRSGVFRMSVTESVIAAALDENVAA